MKTINGIYTSAIIFTTKNENTNIDQYAIAQLQALCDNPVNHGCKFRIMPDVHPGKVGTIGLTQTIGNAILPNVVGIDIGCGMTLAQIKGKKCEFQKLDSIIRESVPSGFTARKKLHRFAENFDLSSLYCFKSVRKDKALYSLGTLGSGNHFIEVDKDTDGNTYIVIHSGSRHLGKEVTEYYLDMGQQVLKEHGIKIPYEMTYLEGTLMEQYLHDLEIVQNFATLNREIILDELCKGMKWKVLDSYSCIHNYVESSSTSYNGLPILRKGAISAKKDERVIIPINMRDGILLGKGLGNDEWNASAPHGAGRILKREDVKANYTVSAYKKEMKGIYSSCIGQGTLDEAPFAYRSIDEIQDVIQDTVSITNVLKPLYNFKSSNA
ncbi:RtcB family protein [Hespellia stercorisuis]|uniref:3'-phosphate/5'-hydroxy nucleic acid ligase n=1 Tax=Hespellia stercorisuis DSM 15480 TaxID=1121950 RepID=A0A1M6N8C1_9FIRM|nr:RtcB family protein [Hespellia stercorisuis]SHJ91897.1 RNA-splicing ligase RtcB, repairs tRNA damage [Hespellia stercorisuis DSM 15480]